VLDRTDKLRWHLRSGQKGFEKAAWRGFEKVRTMQKKGGWLHWSQPPVLSGARNVSKTYPERIRNKKAASPCEAGRLIFYGGSCGVRTCDSLLKRLSAILYMDFHLLIYSFKNS